MQRTAPNNPSRDPLPTVKRIASIAAEIKRLVERIEDRVDDGEFSGEIQWDEYTDLEWKELLELFAEAGEIVLRDED